MKRHRLVRTVAALGALAALLAPSFGPAAPFATYAGGATLVAKQAGAEPMLDDGGAVCMGQPAVAVSGVGGGCVSFPQDPQARPAILVRDAVAGTEVAFQVCIDMNQDGHCYMSPEKPPQPCEDVMAFSHADDGTFFNPLGFYREPVTGILKPLPTSIPPFCVHPEPPRVGAPWQGYVVFLCEGVHATDELHAHAASTGTIQVVPLPPASTGTGNFCQTIRDQFKEYTLI